MKYLLCIASYQDDRQELFVKHHSPRNREYCKIHDFKYIEITDLKEIPEHCRRRKIVWYRFFLIRYWIEKGILKEGDIISQIDADIVIINAKLPLQPSEGKSFAYAIDSCNTHCMGVFSLRVNKWTRRMLNLLLDEDRWSKYRDAPFWEMFHEQASWYSLAGIKDTFADPQQPGWNTIENLGWGSTKRNDPVYTVDELKKNVEILPVEWNVTDFVGGSKYFRFPTKTQNRTDIIFKHFAGTKYWGKHWYQIPLQK